MPMDFEYFHIAKTKTYDKPCVYQNVEHFCRAKTIEFA